MGEHEPALPGVVEAAEAWLKSKLGLGLSLEDFNVTTERHVDEKTGHELVGFIPKVARVEVTVETDWRPAIGTLWLHLRLEAGVWTVVDLAFAGTPIRRDG